MLLQQSRRDKNRFHPYRKEDLRSGGRNIKGAKSRGTCSRQEKLYEYYGKMKFIA